MLLLLLLLVLVLLLELFAFEIVTPTATPIAVFGLLLTESTPSLFSMSSDFTAPVPLAWPLTMSLTMPLPLPFSPMDDGAFPIMICNCYCYCYCCCTVLYCTTSNYRNQSTVLAVRCIVCSVSSVIYSTVLKNTKSVYHLSIYLFFSYLIYNCTVQYNDRIGFSCATLRLFVFRLLLYRIAIVSRII